MREKALHIDSEEAKMVPLELTDGCHCPYTSLGYTLDSNNVHLRDVKIIHYVYQFLLSEDCYSVLI